MVQSIESGTRHVRSGHPDPGWTPPNAFQGRRRWHSRVSGRTARRLADLSVFDAGTLADLCRDIEPSVVSSLLLDFVKDLQARLERIAAAAAADNLQTLAFESHAISGCSDTFGALRLADLCRGVERAVEEGDARQALALARAVRQTGTETLEAFQRFS